METWILVEGRKSFLRVKPSFVVLSIENYTGNTLACLVLLLLQLSEFFQKIDLAGSPSFRVVNEWLTHHSHSSQKQTLEMPWLFLVIWVIGISSRVSPWYCLFAGPVNI